MVSPVLAESTAILMVEKLIPLFVVELVSTVILFGELDCALSCITKLLNTKVVPNKACFNFDNIIKKQLLFCV